MVQKICQVCKQNFDAKGNTKMCQKCCHKLCVECGKDFTVTYKSKDQKFCSKKCSNNNGVVKQKIHETAVKNHGGIGFAGDQHNWMLDKTPEELIKIRKKQKDTVKKLYGVENISQSQKIKEKRAITNLERYGAESVLSKNSNIRGKIEEENKKSALIRSEKMRKYWNNLSLQEKKRIFKKRDEGFKKFLENISEEEKQNLRTQQSESRKRYLASLSYEDKREVATHISDGLKNYWENLTEEEYIKAVNCHTSHIQNSSIGEREMISFIEQYASDLQKNCRNLIPPLEVDAYIPSLKLAFEFNGLYYHSEKIGIDKNYHYNKWLKCQNQGVQLIQIWEDEWQTNKTLVESFIKNKLQVSNAEKIHARKTNVVTCNFNEISDFLENNHIQGAATGSIYLGLKYHSKLVAVMVMKKRKYREFELERYATNALVRGGFTKLLTFFEKNEHPQKIITFSDNCISDGKLYKNNGFVQEGFLKPDYKYFVSHRREHKFNYRLNRFKTDSKLKYVEGATESELAKINKLFRIWDAGKIRWVREYKEEKIK